MVDTATGSNGNHDQIRMIAEAMAESMAAKYAPPKAEVPAPLKWAAGIASGVFAALAVAGALWIANTLQSTSDTVIRMDERMNRFLTDIDDLESRVGDLENYHKEGRGR